MPMNRFPRTARVRSGADFDRIFKHGRRVALPVLALHWQADPADPAEGVPGPLTVPVSGVQPRPSRLGLAVSRKVDPHAVGRNRIKRVLRDSFRRHRDLLAGGDFVVVARVGASRCTGDELRRAFLSLLVRAGALPASAALVTMPTAAPSSPLPSSEPASAPRVG